MSINWLVLPTLGIALALFVVGEKSVRYCPTFRRKVALLAIWFLFGIPGFLLPLYYLHWFDRARWFYEFRSIPFMELSASGVGLFAGGVAEMMAGRRVVSRRFLIVLLCLGITGPYLKPVVAPIAASRFVDRWQDDVCMQSTLSSCGAASAATVFRCLGIEVSEREIARECFTYRGGTENWYIARAFRRRGCSVNYRIEEEFPVDLNTPAIAGVRVGGMGHFIAILGREEDRYIIGDPFFGRQEVPVDRIRDKFDFAGFFMEIGKSG